MSVPDDVVVEGVDRGGDGLFAVGPVAGELADHRVVEHADL